MSSPPVSPVSLSKTSSLPCSPVSPVSSNRTFVKESKTCTVIVGGKHMPGQRIPIDIDLIGSRSAYFRGAIDDALQKPARYSPIIRLPFDNPTLFENYLRLVYKSRLPKDIVPLSMLYVLCERLQDVEAKNTIMDSLVHKMRDSFDRSGEWILFYPPNDVVIPIIYEGTPVNSPARRLLADTFIRFNLGDRLKTTQYVLPEEFREDVMKKNFCLGERYRKSKKRTLEINDYMQGDTWIKARSSMSPRNSESTEMGTIVTTRTSISKERS